MGKLAIITTSCYLYTSVSTENRQVAQLAAHCAHYRVEQLRPRTGLRRTTAYMHAYDTTLLSRFEVGRPPRSYDDLRGQYGIGFLEDQLSHGLI